MTPGTSLARAGVAPIQANHGPDRGRRHGPQTLKHDTTAARGQGRTFLFGDRAIEPPDARPMLGFTLEGLPAVLEPPGVIGVAMAATGSRIQPIAMAGSGTL